MRNRNASKRSVFFTIAVFLAAIAVAFDANPASAAVLAYKWENTPHSIGDCSSPTNNNEYVRWVQVEMWAMHRYSNMNSSNVDGVWGINTRNAVKGWQSANGYPADGCVGWYTKSSFRRYPWLSYVGGSNYHLQGPYSEYVTYSLDLCWWYQWFDGWHLPRTGTACEYGSGTQQNAYYAGGNDSTVGFP